MVFRWFRKKKVIDLTVMPRKQEQEVKAKEAETQEQGTGNAFGILAGLASSTTSNTDVSTSYSPGQHENSGLKEIEERLRRLERRLYKLIERVELLERKAGVETGGSFF